MEDDNDSAKVTTNLTFTAGRIVGTVVAILCALSEGHQTGEKVEAFTEVPPSDFVAVNNESVYQGDPAFSPGEA